MFVFKSLFNICLRNFQRALEKGDVVEVAGKDGQTLYAAAVVKTGKRVGTKEESGVKSDAKLEQSQYEAATAALKKMSWDFTVPSKKNLDKEMASHSLEKKTMAKIEEACAAMNRTSKEAEKRLPQIQKLEANSAVKACAELKAALKDLYKHISHVNEIQMGLNEPWQNSEQVRNDLIAAASATICCQDSVDIAKALIKAQGATNK